MNRGEGLRHGWLYLVLAALATALAIAILWLAGRALLLLWVAIMVAVVFDAMARGLAWLTGIGRRWCLLIAFFALLGAIAGFAWMTLPGMMREAQDFIGTLGKAWQEFSQRIGSTELGRQALDAVQGSTASGGVTGEIARHVWTAASITVSGLVQALLVTMAGLYLAVNPGIYLRGLLHLVPVNGRERTREVLFDLAHILRRWFLGQLAAMALIGAAAGVAYWLLGLPQPVMLGVIAGLAEFVPYLGPILGAIPALLVAFSVDMQHVIYVLGIYLAIHATEGNLLIPMIHRWAVYVPPALTLSAELILGLLGGILGILAAVPLTAALTVAVREAYVEDVLDDQTAG